MKTTRLALALLACLTCLAAFAAGPPPQTDQGKCKDHPLFPNRMPDYWIRSCDEREFDARDFVVAMEAAKPKTEHVEGHLWKLTYYPQASATTKPSDLQIIRNYENAVKAAGGKVVWSDKGRATFLFVQGGKETWVDLSAEFTGKYGLTIIQRDAMAQSVAADATALGDALKNTGHAAVYGILFDTDKALIKPESAQALGEIAKLLKAEPALNLYVVGHTDNAGTPEHNLQLSETRAQAVMQALVKDHGIAPARLSAFGCGPYAPVASNDAEEGRAKNRRVELVKR